MKKKRLLSMLLAVALLFSLTACARGDDNNESTPPTQGTESSAPNNPEEVAQGVTDDTIYIGTASASPLTTDCAPVLSGSTPRAACWAAR